MKKFLILPSLLLTLGANAQEFHLSGGYNGSNVSESGKEQWTGKAGYQFGADLLLGSRWFVKPGIHFLVRNLNYSVASTAGDTVGTTTTEFKYTSRSLRVPLVLGVNLMDPSSDPAVNVYAFGGPTAIFNLNADLNNSELNVETKAAQWYLGFGAGVELGFLFVEAGYDVAMTNVFEGDGFQTNPKVNYVYAAAGLRLQLAK